MTEIKLDFDKQGGLVPVIVTDYKTGQVLMIASSWKRDTYHFPVNPPHLARVLELLKDRTISVMIGA